MAPAISPGDAWVTQVSTVKKHFTAVAQCVLELWVNSRLKSSQLPGSLPAMIHSSHVVCCHFVSCVLVSGGWEEQVTRSYVCDVWRQS